jgi:hypothetical protein
MPLHANPVAEDRASGEWRVGVRGEDGDRLPLLPEQRQDRVDERRLSRAGSAREACNARRARVLAQGVLQLPQGRITAFDQADRTRQGADVPGPKAV